MDKNFEKEIGLITESQFSKLNNSLIVLFGLGGVGSYTFEILVRSGINNFIIIDKDQFDITNINRQLEANLDTIKKNKVNIYKNRAKKINKNINIISICENVDKNNVSKIIEQINNFKDINNIYVIDCIDDIRAKIEIIKYCNSLSLPIISSMGTANHFSTENIKITDLKNTKYCPLAKKIRKLIKNLSIDSLDCLYIDEEPINVSINNENIHTSTISYVPATCGIKIAEYVIKKIIVK